MIRLKSLLNESATAAPTVMTFLKARGLTTAQAAGIAGNLQQESGFSPIADNNKKSGEFGEKRADGTIANNGTNQQLQIGSISKDFLLKIR